MKTCARWLRKWADLIDPRHDPAGFMTVRVDVDLEEAHANEAARQPALNPDNGWPPIPRPLPAPPRPPKPTPPPLRDLKEGQIPKKRKPVHA